MANETVIIDRQGNVPTELAVAELIQSGELHRHARKALQVYLKRRNAFAQLLRENFGDDVEFKVPAGGLSFWLKFEEPVLDAIEKDAPKCGVRFLPSRSFAIAPYQQRGLRLGYASLSPEEASEAVRRLRRAYQWPLISIRKSPLTSCVSQKPHTGSNGRLGRPNLTEAVRNEE